jgi:2,5-dioxopentanoate dehydrogenase
MSVNKVLINGEWCEATHQQTFSPFSPTTGEKLEQEYPISDWIDCDKALTAATLAYQKLQVTSRESIAQFLELYADKIAVHSDELVELAHQETGLAKSPRLADVEIPRTVSQIKLAAHAAREASWTMPTIDTGNNIRSMLQSIGPVVVFGPNNFPFAFGSASGSDFASAIAAGNPVIAKAHPSHPGTTKLFAELAQLAVVESGLPKSTVQLVYAMSNESGLRLVSDPRTAATGFTGSRAAGLALKAAAEQAGKLIYLELSSVNPVFVLQGALNQRKEQVADEFAGSCTMAAGQLCTKPGLLVVPDSTEGDEFVKLATEKFESGVVGTLLSENAAEHIKQTADKICAAGGKLLVGNTPVDEARFCYNNTLLTIDGEQFIKDSETFQSEMFGNASLIIRSNSTEQSLKIIQCLEGNLTGCFYSDTEGADDQEYTILEPALRHKVGRIINDKMPTGVAVSAAMNHGGPFPASGHPGFTAVGMPAAIKRFAALKCYDGVRANRLPELLTDENQNQSIWRLIDGRWSQGNV